MEIIRKEQVTFQDLEDGETYVTEENSQVRMKVSGGAKVCLETGEYRSGIRPWSSVIRIKTELHIIES